MRPTPLRIGIVLCLCSSMQFVAASSALTSSETSLHPRIPIRTWIRRERPSTIASNRLAEQVDSNLGNLPMTLTSVEGEFIEDARGGGGDSVAERLQAKARRQAPDAVSGKWADSSDSTLQVNDMDSEYVSNSVNDMDSEYVSDSELWPVGDYNPPSDPTERSTWKCATGDEPDSPPPPPSPPSPCVGGDGVCPGCWVRMPDCCDQKLKETTTSWNWFLFEAKDAAECTQAENKVNWWCCRWSPSQEPGTSRKSIVTYTTKDKLPKVPDGPLSPQCTKNP